MKNYWIQDAVKKGKKGVLHRQLGIPQGQKIPKRLLTTIKNANIGKTVKNPTKTGKRRIKVTNLLKKRVVLANTLRGLK